MYEQTFGTDWETIADPDEVIERAFALGVATRLDEEHPGELARLREQIDTTYDQSLVKLAYQKGRNQAATVDADEDGDVWEELVEKTVVVDPRSETVEVDFDEEDDSPDDTLPGALRRVDIDTLPDDSTDRVARPSFLDRLGGGGPARPGDGGDRSVFGRPAGRLGRRRTDRAATATGGAEENGRDENDDGETDADEPADDPVDGTRSDGVGGRADGSDGRSGVDETGARSDVSDDARPGSAEDDRENR